MRTHPKRYGKWWLVDGVVIREHEEAERLLRAKVRAAMIRRVIEREKEAEHGMGHRAG